MEDVRVAGLSRVSYEAPVLAVVAVGCGRLLSASPWTAEAFGSTGADDVLWGGGGFSAEAFHVPEDDWDWSRSNAEAFEPTGDDVLWGDGGFSAEEFDPVGAADVLWGGGGFFAEEFYGPGADCGWSRSNAEAFDSPGGDLEWKP